MDISVELVRTVLLGTLAVIALPFYALSCFAP